MKSLLACGLALAVLTAGGCAFNRSEKGGEVTGTERDFRISAPLMATSIKQGEVQTVQVNLHRGTQFNQDVTIHVKTPDGISVEPRNSTIRASATESVQLVLTAAANAPIATHQIEVQATPESGKSTWVQFPVKVTPR